MSAHTHTAITPGCYRCDLNIDETAAAQQDEAEQAEREAACVEHEWRGFAYKFGAWRECWKCGAEEDEK